jgi:subtilisin family serine protease
MASRRSTKLAIYAIVFLAGCLHNLAFGFPGLAGVERASVLSLLEKAQSEGTVAIIVGLNVSFQREGTLSQSAVLNQRAAIAQAQDALLQAFSAHQVSGIKRFKTIPYIAMQVDQAALSTIASHPLTWSIVEDRTLTPLQQDDGIPDIGGSPSGDFHGFTGAGWTVAILDSGVDTSHPFFGGRVVAEACYSTNRARDSASSLCPGGASELTGPGTGTNCPVNISGCEHGTHVAGIAAGNGAGIPGAPQSGVAKDATIITIKIASRVDDLQSCGQKTAPCTTFFDSDLLRGLEQVLLLHNSSNLKIASVNLSLGSSVPDDSECDRLATQEGLKGAIDNLHSVGIATIIASGNESLSDRIDFPACVSSAISVGATETGQSIVAPFSNSGPFLDLLAPGDPILSSVPGGGFALESGTSMATPHVTGAWAVYKQKFPMASVDEVLHALQSTGMPISDTRNGLVRGRIQLDAAIGGTTPPTLDSITLQSISPPAETINIGDTVTFTLTVQYTLQSAASGKVETDLNTPGIAGGRVHPSNVAQGSGTVTITARLGFVSDSSQCPSLSGAVDACLALQGGQTLEIYPVLRDSNDRLLAQGSSTSYSLSSIPPNLIITDAGVRCSRSGRASKALRLRNPRARDGGSDVIIQTIDKAGGGWGNFVLNSPRKLPFTLKAGRTLTIRATGTCASSDLSLKVTFSNGAMITQDDRSEHPTLEVNVLAGWLVVHTASGVDDVQQLSAQIYNLSGQKLFEAQAQGSRLVALARDSLGHPLANGIYLVLITVERPDGTVDRQLKKVLMLR